MTTIAIVGAGSVGRALGRGLCDAGWTIAAVVARSHASAVEAVRAIGGGRAFNSLTRLLLEADVVLVTAPEHSIANVAAELARLGAEEWRGKIVLHTGCTLNRAALEPIERCGAATGSITPMQFFGRRAISSFDGILFAVEGSPTAVRMARKIARSLGGLPVRVRSERKALCGVAGEMVTAQALALVEAAMRLLVDAGFSRRQASRAALHLSRAALLNFERFGGAQAWSAASVSGDRKTVAEHTRVLAKYPRQYAAAYAAVERLGEFAFSRREDDCASSRRAREVRAGRAE